MRNSQVPISSRHARSLGRTAVPRFASDAAALIGPRPLAVHKLPVACSRSEPLSSGRSPARMSPSPLASVAAWLPERRSTVSAWSASSPDVAAHACLTVAALVYCCAAARALV